MYDARSKDKPPLEGEWQRGQEKAFGMFFYFPSFFLLKRVLVVIT